MNVQQNLHAMQAQETLILVQRACKICNDKTIWVDLRITLTIVVNHDNKVILTLENLQ